MDVVVLHGQHRPSVPGRVQPSRMPYAPVDVGPSTSTEGKVNSRARCRSEYAAACGIPIIFLGESRGRGPRLLDRRPQRRSSCRLSLLKIINDIKRPSTPLSWHRPQTGIGSEGWSSEALERLDEIRRLLDSRQYAQAAERPMRFSKPTRTSGVQQSPGVQLWFSLGGYPRPKKYFAIPYSGSPKTDGRRATRSEPRADPVPSWRSRWGDPII